MQRDEADAALGSAKAEAQATTRANRRGTAQDGSTRWCNRHLAAPKAFIRHVNLFVCGKINKEVMEYVSVGRFGSIGAFGREYAYLASTA